MRPRVGLFFFLLFSTQAGAGIIRLATDRPDAIYRTGETAVVTITVDTERLEGPWTGSLSLQTNFAGPAVTVPFQVTSEPYPFRIPNPGSGQRVLTAVIRSAENPSLSHRASIGLLAGPETFLPPAAEPEDFDRFWQHHVAKWRALPKETLLTPVESPVEGVDCFDLTIRIEGQIPVSGYLALPKASGEGALPALLHLHGAGVRSSNLATAVRFAQEGFLALDLNAHGLPNGRPPEFYESKAAHELFNYRRAGIESRETWYFLGMFLRVIMANDFLAERPEWNGRDLVLRGSSQGGAQALAGAGLDPRVTVTAASVPALCDLSATPPDRKPGWPQPAADPAIEPETRAGILEAVRYFDGIYFASRIRGPAIVSLGLTDAVCPAIGIQAAINQMRGEAVPLYRPAMGHAIPAEIEREFDEFIRTRVSFSSIESAIVP